MSSTFLKSSNSLTSRVPQRFLFPALILLLVLLFVANISLGSVSIPFAEVLKSLFGRGASEETWQYIILGFRLPKAIVAMCAGIGLSISGLMMQTLFRNPLAGPFVLGLTSGSSLGVAFIIMGAAFLPPIFSALVLSGYGIVAASVAGSFLVLMLVLVVSQKLRDATSVLIVGLMFGSFASAIVGILSYFSTAAQLQKFTFWAMGNLGNLPFSSVAIVVVGTFTGIAISFATIKPLNALLLGENYAASIGLNIKRTRNIIILATSILTGAITAFAGPIAFVGLAVPHIAKILMKTSDHRQLFWATILFGAIVMLGCDIIAQLPTSDLVLPINAVTSLVGAPIVVYLLVRKRKY